MKTLLTILVVLYYLVVAALIIITIASYKLYKEKQIQEMTTQLDEAIREVVREEIANVESDAASQINIH